MLSRKLFVHYYFPAILWALMIFVSSSIPGNDFPRITFPHLDKIVHMIYYGLLFFFVHNALRHQEHFPFLARNAKEVTFAFCVLYGVSDEFHQLFVPGRSCEIGDLCADAAGALLCLFFLHVAGKKTAERSS